MSFIAVIFLHIFINFAYMTFRKKAADKHFSPKRTKRILGRLSLLFLLIISPLRLFSQVNAEQVMAIGRNVMSLEDYVLAIQYFNYAIKAKPYLSDPYFYRGLAKLQLEDFIGVEQDCSMAIDRNKFKKEAYRVRGFARQRLGKDSLALQDYEVVLDDNPYDKDILFYKGLAEMDLNRYEKADSTLAKVLELDPDNFDALSAKAQMYLVRGDTVSALNDLHRSIELSKTQINPYLMLADIYVKQQKWGDALEAVDEIIKFRPDETDLYMNRAYIRYMNDNYIGAMDDYNYAIELDPKNYDAIFNRGLLRYEVRELDKAIQDFTTVVNYDPNNYHALFNRALIYLNQKNYNKAIPDLQKITSRYPKFYLALVALAQIQLDMGQKDQAVNTLTKIINIDPKNFFAIYNREQIYMQQKKYSKAQADIQLILKLYPRFYPAYYDLAQCKYESGDEKGAILAMNKGDELVRNYVDDPRRYPLDRPAISKIPNYNPIREEKLTSYRSEQQVDDTEEMEKFDRLITTRPQSSTSRAYNERIKGKVQDTEDVVGLEPMFSLSTFPPEETFKAEGGFYKELTEINQAGLLSERLYMVADDNVADKEGRAEQLFDLQEKYSLMLSGGNSRPIDYLARATVYTLLKNYDGALDDLDHALKESPDFVVAIMMEGYIYARKALAPTGQEGLEEKKPHEKKYEPHYATLAMEAFDKALQLNPRLLYAWFNKGNLYFEFGDYEGAAECYNKVLGLDSEFGPALFNRGLTYLKKGERDKAFADFSLAGQLGVLQSYSVMKKLQ